MQLLHGSICCMNIFATRSKSQSRKSPFCAWLLRCVEGYAYAVAEKYGINLRGAGQDITIKYNPNLRLGIYGRTTAATPNVIEIGPDGLVSGAELANTIAHELNHARDFMRGGIAPEPSAYSAGDALEDYINGGR